MNEGEALRTAAANKKLGTIVRALKNRFHDNNTYFILLTDGTTIEFDSCNGNYEVGDKVWYYPPVKYTFLWMELSTQRGKG